ncbi:GFA family protein [Paracoccus aeridis]|uniref:GFA family protein n=1 Tax=Paracoccus aeridis TaxID=1966466 RepID=UPI0010AAC43A|nr:GFA family protein [Paracoccus aeridis]
MTVSLTGGCLCGAVRFTAEADDDGIVACHCTMCRRWSGHVWAAAGVTALRIEDERALRWYRSSGIGERGFCAECGSSLFWRGVRDGHAVEDDVEVSGGALDAPTGLRLSCHARVDFKGDYYAIADGVPQRTEGPAA